MKAQEFKFKNKKVSVVVKVNNGVLIDEYKVDLYCSELFERINTHIIKGLA